MSYHEIAQFIKVATGITHTQRGPVHHTAYAKRTFFRLEPIPSAFCHFHFKALSLPPKPLLSMFFLPCHSHPLSAIHFFSCCLAQFLESQFKGPKQFDILIYLPHSGFVCNCCCHSCCCWCCLAIVAAAMAATVATVATVAAVAWHKHNRLIGSARRTWLWLRTEVAAKLRLVNGKLMLL